VLIRENIISVICVEFFSFEKETIINISK